MLGYISIITAVCLFSTIEVVSKLILPNIDPLMIAFLRFFICGTIFLCFSYRHILKISKYDLARILFVGIFGNTVSIGLYSLGLKYVGAAQGAVISSLNPVFATIFAYFILKEKLTKNKILGILLGFAGVYVICFGFSGFSVQTITGPVLMLLSSITLGYYFVGGKKFSDKYGIISVLGVILTVGSFCYLPFIRNFHVLNFAYTMKWILYLSFGATGAAYILFFYGLHRVTVTTGASIYYFKPIIASVLSVMTLNESLAINFYIGLIIIFSSLGFTMYNGQGNVYKTAILRASRIRKKSVRLAKHNYKVLKHNIWLAKLHKKEFEKLSA